MQKAVQERGADPDGRRDMLLRHVRATDYERAVSLAEAWWDERPRGVRLARVFFVQFASMSFVLEEDEKILGLVLGHLSQTRPDEASAYFVGVDPACRRLGMGRRLYERFFAAAQMRERRAVRAYVVPTDSDALAFHFALGFEALPGDGVVDGVPVCLDHGGRGSHRVIFRRAIGPEVPADPPALVRLG